MSFRIPSRRACLIPLCLISLGAGQVLGASALSRDGGEFAITPALAGEQVYPQLALGNAGGYLVWEDNATDGDGQGISARRVDANFNGINGVFRVNATSAGDQEKPRAAILQDGGAVFVWQGGVQGSQRIYARFLNGAGTFKTTTDVLVSSYASGAQTEPAVAVLADGSVVVIWSSLGQDGSLLGVYGQRLTPAGAKSGTEFRVNQTTLNNQRSPSIAPLASGGFIVAWVTESFHRTVLSANQPGGGTDPSPGAQEYDVQVFARRFGADGAALGAEFAVSTNARIAANPGVAAGSDGTSLVTWSSRAPAPAGQSRSRSGWDIFARGISADGAPTGEEFLVNSHVPGDQFWPKVAAVGAQCRYFAVWTSLAQDGSREGVFGRALSGGGVVGEEAQINTEAASQQVHPAVGANGAGSALVVWSSFLGGDQSFDLFAQRLVEAPGIAAPEAPFVLANSPAAMVVTWPEASGLGTVTYLLFVDDATTPVETLETHYVLEGLLANSTHAFKLGYKLPDGRVSAPSVSASGKVWDLDRNFDGLPDDWQATYWPVGGARPGAWVDSDGDGASNLQELLAGTNPADPTSVLRLAITESVQGSRLGWNTQPGAVYQVQVSSDLGGWVDEGPSRLAAGASDSVPISRSGSLQMYRIVRIR